MVLVNDGGAPPPVPADYPLPVVRVDLAAEPRAGPAAAEAGVAAATGDFVAFLDDDDLAAPEHLATLAGLVQAAGRARRLHGCRGGRLRAGRPDGRLGLPRAAPALQPRLRSRRPLVDNYIPFNTLLIERRLFAEAGPFDPSLPFFEDWDFLIRLVGAARRSTTCARVTCEYRHFRGGGHHIFGERPRERGDFLAVKARVLAKHADRLAAGRPGPGRGHPARRAGGRARGPGRRPARAGRAARASCSSCGPISTALARRARGPVAGALRPGGALPRPERRAGRAAAGQRPPARRACSGSTTRSASSATASTSRSSNCGRTYAEIERLNGMIREMETTRAWRLHQWVQRAERRSMSPRSPSLSSEPIRPRMAGIGIRYFELARRLTERGIDIVLVSPAEPEETAELSLAGVEIRRFERGRLAEILAGCDARRGPGAARQRRGARSCPQLPVAIDLYDPWLVENLSYAATLGLDPYRNDHATWVLQMSRGDFFLCSSEEQRTFYLGFLTALGRVNPERLRRSGPEP